MVEFTKGAIITLIGGTIVVIGILLPWWTLKFHVYTINLNPLFGMKIPPAGFTAIYEKYIHLFGLLTLAGGILLILTIVKKPLGIIGGSLAIGGAIAFILIMAVGQVVISYFPYFSLVCPGLFGSYYYWSYYWNWALGIGLYIACVGAALGLVGSLLKSNEA